MPRQLYFVVGDRALLDVANGIYAPTLEAMRDRLLREHRPGSYTLVIRIHGSEDILAAVPGGILRDRDGPLAYDAEDIPRIFGGRDFVRWRDRFGPSRVVLNACQVTMPFERVILNALLRSGSGQTAQGLGPGCRPGTEVMRIEYRGRDIRTRRQWNRIPDRDRRGLEQQLRQLNRDVGYFGAPSVPDDLVLDYYFDEEPLGGWPVVMVTHLRQQTSIPFYNRAQHPRFLRQCYGHIGSLPGRRPTVPPAIRR